MGDPGLSRSDEFELRLALLRRALKALEAPIEGQTTFD
jgi:hypothetical protein